MSRVLVLHAHPGPGRSKVNRELARVARELDDVSFVDLYALYPRFRIDINAEQARLVEHELIVLQFPFYWYSMPALLKEYLDRVLEFGFAYGEGGDRLAGKCLLVATSAGGAEAAYTPSGRNRFPIRHLLTPLEQTANLCGMLYLAPVVLFAALAASEDGRAATHALGWRALLEAARDDRLDVDAAKALELLDLGTLPLLTAA